MKLLSEMSQNRPGRSAKGRSGLGLGWVRSVLSAPLLAALVAVPASFSSLSARADDDLLSLLGGGEAAGPAADASITELRALIGRTTAEQNIFLDFFARGEWDKALYQWPLAFAGTDFAKAGNGQALHALLVWRNGLPLTALEALLALEKPQRLAGGITRLWKAAAPDTHPAWSFVSVKWAEGWTQVFGIATEVRVVARQMMDPGAVDAIKDLIRKTQPGTRERALLEWQLVLGLSLKDEAGSAGQALSHLLKAPNNPIQTDLMTMTAARLLFQNGYLDAAIRYYGQVPKTSDFWFEAQEEMGWSYLRKGEPQNAVALSKTLMAPAFASQIGPEALFLSSLSHLKVCDYPAVVTTLNDFRIRFKDRSKNLMALAENADTPEVGRLVQRLQDKPVRLTELGSDATALPRLVTRDESLRRWVEIHRELEREAKTAGELYARSLVGGTGQVGFQAALERFKQSVEQRQQTARSGIFTRIKQLASEELTEIGEILQKLHIVEAEVLQQVALSQRVSQASQGQKAEAQRGSTGSQSRDRVWFPFEGETWFDELANFQVDIKKGCQAARR